MIGRKKERLARGKRWSISCASGGKASSIWWFEIWWKIEKERSGIYILRNDIIRQFYWQNILEQSYKFLLIHIWIKILLYKYYYICSPYRIITQESICQTFGLRQISINLRIRLAQKRKARPIPCCSSRWKQVWILYYISPTVTL